MLSRGGLCRSGRYASKSRLQEGEAYREKLAARARELGVELQVVFFNQFVDQATLLDYISMCDVYVTPYLNESQMTSGTLAYSFGRGRRWFRRLIGMPGAVGGWARHSGSVCDSKALGAEIAGLLTNDVRRHAMRKRAYAFSREMTWKQTAIRYLAVLDAARADGSRLNLRLGPTSRRRARDASRNAARPFFVDV